MNPLKQASKRLLRLATRGLPERANRLVAEVLLEQHGDWRTFQNIAARYGVVSVEVDGRYGRIQGDVRDTAVLKRYAETKGWAEPTNDMVNRFLSDREGATYVDIGANIGLTTIPIAQNPRVTCHAFEPDPLNLEHLRRNVATNCRHGNVILHQLALYDRSGTMLLELSNDNMGDHRIRMRIESGFWNEQNRKTTQVRADRLDSVLKCDELRKPLVVKSDTQGAEPAVFAGGAKTVAAAELLLFEYWPYGMKRLGLDPRSMFPLLLEHFKLGAVLREDSEASGEFLPVGDTIDALGEFWNVEGRDFFDVAVSKTSF